MEEILQHAVVKRGLIIAYYFSNIWYRKGLFGERTIPDPNDTDPIEHPEPTIDEIDPEEEENINYTHKNPLCISWPHPKDGRSAYRFYQRCIF